MTASGDFERRRREQQVKWMWAMFEERTRARLRADAAIRSKVRELESSVAQGKLSPAVAADTIAELLEKK
jgi:LAO/AO transport system kinase